MNRYTQRREIPLKMSQTYMDSDALRKHNRLAQYEDILYDPDGTEIITLDRLREMAEADRDGRCVVLPCKVGDTVYAIVHCDEVLKDCDDDYVAGTGAITCPFEGRCTFEECDESNKILAETCVSGLWCESDGVWKVFLEHINADIGVADFGKTVFLTRPEAEAALKGASNAE